MSEVKTAIPSAVSSSAARPPERTAAAAPHSSAHRRVLDLQGGGRRAMMLVGLAQHNQPQPQSEPDLALLVPVLPHSPQTSSCHLQEAQLARLLSVSACNDSFSPPPLHHHHHLRPPPPGTSLPPSRPLCAQQRRTRISQRKSRAR